MRAFISDRVRDSFGYSHNNARLALSAIDEAKRILAETEPYIPPDDFKGTPLMNVGHKRLTRSDMGMTGPILAEALRAFLADDEVR